MTTIGWKDWERLHGSLDYAWDRLQALRPVERTSDREEYAALADEAIRIADRLVRSSGPDVPALHTAALRQQWGAASRKASVTREQIVEHGADLREHLDEGDRD